MDFAGIASQRFELQSQLVDDIRTKIQELDHSFKFLFGAHAGRLEPRVDTRVSLKAIQSLEVQRHTRNSDCV